MGKTPNPTLVTLGRIVRFCRDAADIKQADLARTLGYSVGWLSNVETGQLRARRDQVVAIEEALGLPKATLTDVYDDLRHDHPVERFERYEEREHLDSGDTVRDGRARGPRRHLSYPQLRERTEHRVR